jgi:short-subunit dehydrogenase
MAEPPERRYGRGPSSPVPRSGSARSTRVSWPGAVSASSEFVDRDGPALRKTADEIAGTGARMRHVELDLARADVAGAVQVATAGLEIGLLVYNAAIGTVSRFLEMTPALMQAMLDVNCRAPMLLVRALAPPMVARGRGGIVVMSSMSGNFGSAQLAVYAATKAFDLVFADALWVELREHGVDVLAVQPGSTRTPGWESSQTEEMRAPGPHVMEPAAVVAEALDALGVEPVVVPGEQNREGARLLAGLGRRAAIELMSGITGALVPSRR